jgi:hypothetical protein
MTMRWPGHIACTGFWWEDNIKVDIREEVGCGGINWVHLAPDRDQWQALVKIFL